MRIARLLFASFLVSLLFLPLIFPSSVQAQASCAPGLFTAVESGSNNTELFVGDAVELIFDGTKATGFNPGVIPGTAVYNLMISHESGSSFLVMNVYGSSNGNLIANGSVNTRINVREAFSPNIVAGRGLDKPGRYTVSIVDGVTSRVYCQNFTFDLAPIAANASCDLNVFLSRRAGDERYGNIGITLNPAQMAAKFQTGSQPVSVYFAQVNAVGITMQEIPLSFNGTRYEGSSTIDFNAYDIDLDNGRWKMDLYYVASENIGQVLAADMRSLVIQNHDFCDGTITIERDNLPITDQEDVINQGENVTEGIFYKIQLCEQIRNSDLRSECNECFGGQGDQGIWTAVGCIKTTPEAIVQAVVRVGLSTGGGVGLLMFLAGSFMYSISQGDPKRTNDARDMITSSAIGLLFIIFSVSILQFIGVQILRIPGFGG